MEHESWGREGDWEEVLQPKEGGRETEREQRREGALEWRVGLCQTIIGQLSLGKID